MRWSDAHYGGQAEEQRARDAAWLGGSRPDRLLSVDRYVLDREATTWGERRDGTPYPVARVWQRTGADLVAFDLDHLEPRDTEPDAVVALRIRRTLALHGYRVVSIVATSRTGLQVLARVEGWHDSERLHHNLPRRRSLERAGSAALSALGRGGVVDRSAWAAGRYVRRPGWRVKDGEAVRARLWWADE